VTNDKNQKQKDKHMAKGKIEKLASAWQKSDEPWTFKRHGMELALSPLEYERGDGKYLGLVANEETSFDILEIVTAKNQEQADDEATRPVWFKQKVFSLFNQTIFRPLWRQATAKFPADKVLSDDDKALILAEFDTLLNAEFDAESGQMGRPKDSSYYSRQAVKTKELLIPYAKIGKDKLNDEQKVKVKEITEEYARLVMLSNELRLAEEAKAKEDDDGLLSLLA
jgi:hypothetical protein